VALLQLASLMLTDLLSLQQLLGAAEAVARLPAAVEEAGNAGLALLRLVTSRIRSSICLA